MELLASGPERAPRPPGGAAPAVALAALLVLLGGVVAAATDRPAAERPALSATPSGTFAVTGRVRVYLVLRGSPRAALRVVGARLPGFRGAEAPASFDATGTAAVRVDVTPTCPASGFLGPTALRVRTGGQEQLVPFADGILADVVASRCAGRLGDRESDVRPLLLPAEGGGPGVRVLLQLPSEGPGPLRVDAVEAGPGLVLAGTPPPSLVVPPRRVREVVLDLLPGRCAALPDAPPLLLLVDGVRTVPRVDAGLRAQLAALQVSACRGSR